MDLPGCYLKSVDLDLCNSSTERGQFRIIVCHSHHKEDAYLGPDSVRVSDARTRCKTKITGQSQGKLFGHSQDQLI